MIDTSYLVSNDAAVRKTQNLDAMLDAAFGTEAEIHAQITALTEKPSSTFRKAMEASHEIVYEDDEIVLWGPVSRSDDATWTAPRLQVGESRQFRISGSLAIGTLIQVYRVDSDLYVVTVTVDGKLVPHFTQTWTPERSPDGDARRAAWDYIQTVAADFGGSVKA
jgi:hypothetical protein